MDAVKEPPHRKPNSFSVRDNKCDNNNRHIIIKARRACAQRTFHANANITPYCQDFRMLISSERHRDINMFITQMSLPPFRRGSGVFYGSPALHRH